MAALNESIRELTALTEPLMTVLTAVDRLTVEDMAPDSDELIWDNDVLWPTLVETTLLIWALVLLLRLAVADAAVEAVVELPWAA